MEITLDSFKGCFKKFLNEKQSVKFLTSCVSQGLIPKGLRKSFNLTLDVNDEEFVAKIQAECDQQSSRYLDLILAQKVKILWKLR